MDFFYFAPDGLFGSYAPVPGPDASNAVAVLCYPFGQEYMRAHRAYRQLSVLLSRRGVPVLRFDYYGTGDSAGDGVEASLDRWVRNTRAAMDEARRRSGAERVYLAGLRLGAAVAALAAQGRGEVGRVVLWDPIVSGARMLEELEESATSGRDATWWVNGFPFPPPLRREVEPVRLPALDFPETARVTQVVSHRREEFESLAAALETHEGGFATRHVPSPSDWNYSDDVGGILLPRDMVRAVVDALAA
jgi:pimeloyl-ACP methyl ester carboxylesterase